MADIVDASTRSRMMAGIKGKNTRPEVVVRSLLHRRGFRFRLHGTKLPGKPDIVLPKYRAVLFVHGCFWHGHDCLLFKWPKTRPEFWNAKIEANRVNDRKASRLLLENGWRVGIVWECVLKGVGRMPLDAIGEELSSWLYGTSAQLELRSSERSPQ